MSTKLLNYWRQDHQFTWSSEPRKGLAIVRQRRYLDPFLILTKSIGSVPVGPSNRTRDLPLCSRVLHRLSYSPAADLVTERQQHNALLSTTFFCVAGVPMKRESVKSLQNSVRTHSMVYVRGVELTGKTETFELEFPYSSSLAYAGPFLCQTIQKNV